MKNPVKKAQYTMQNNPILTEMKNIERLISVIHSVISNFNKSK